MIEPTLVANINLATQRMHVLVDGIEEHVWKISSGTRRHNTPTGSWRPYRMHTMWRSRKYRWAPMPHSVFFNGGYAVHATQAIGRLGRPASHGCIRLHPKNAKRFFNLVLEHKRRFTRVNVMGAYAWKGPAPRYRSRPVRRTRYRSRSRYASNPNLFGFFRF